MGWNPKAAQRMMKAFEEFAAECSIIKVYGSEVLDYVVDEGVQIHGGYGYHQDYAVERAYRDSRINRIFEGTNEINRLLATGILLKRAQQGRLGLVKAAKGLMEEILAGPSLAAGDESEERRLVRNAKKIALLLLASVFEKFGARIEAEQEVMSAIADVIMETFAMESALARSEKLRLRCGYDGGISARFDDACGRLCEAGAGGLWRRRRAAIEDDGAAAFREARADRLHCDPASYCSAPAFRRALCCRLRKL